MLKEVTVKRYGELETVYVHIEPYKEKWWYCTVSRIHPSSTRMIGMQYVRLPNAPNDIDEVVKRYCEFLEVYWRAD